MSPYHSPPSSPPRRRRSRTRSIARRLERACCAVATYFPLAFVYSLTTWAVYVEASIGLTRPGKSILTGPLFSFLGLAFYALLNTSYTVAVFTDPGSPLEDRGRDSKYGSKKGGYSHLPTCEPSHAPNLHTVTVSSTGSPRYCKKCMTAKPDRTHHCSTCRRCVLKMDHHCPWLATCVGLRNYKAFLLFLIYTCFLCYTCFAVSGVWAWTEILDEETYIETALPVQVVLLAVISGIIGLVLTGFTSWHLYLATRNQTTIEALEKTRYLSGVRRAVQRNQHDSLHNSSAGNGSGQDPGMAETLQRAGRNILEFHANAVPGATRVEEGEEHSSPLSSQPPALPQSQPGSSPAYVSLARHTYADRERAAERARYEDYLSDQESAGLPNAFDLGWRENLRQLFGENPLLWGLPFGEYRGDGWRWEVSERWRREVQELERKKAERRTVADADDGVAGGMNGAVQREREPHPGRQVWGDGGMGLRGGGGGGDGVSLETLGSKKKGKGRMNWDWDRAAGGEMERFEVSSLSSSSESDEDDERDLEANDRGVVPGDGRDRRKGGAAADQDRWKHW